MARLHTKRKGLGTRNFSLKTVLTFRLPMIFVTIMLLSGIMIINPGIDGFANHLPSSASASAGAPAVTNHVVGKVIVPYAPFSLTYDPPSHNMYVAYPYSNIVSVVSSTLPGKVLGNITFPAGSMPRVMTYVPFNHYLYVADEGTYYLSIINSTTNKIIGRILVGNSPEALAYDYLTQKLYVANYGGGSNGTISVVDVKTNRVSTTITVGFEPQFAAFDPAHREIFIGMPSEQYVTVISDMTNKIVKNIMINAGNTTGVAYNPVNHRMYVTEPFLNNEVLVIDGKTNTVVGNVTVGKFPSSVAFDPKNNETYVTNQFSNSVSLISSTSNTVVDTVPLASLPPPYLSPSALAYDASNGFMYVANTGFNTLSLVSSLKN